MKVLMVNHGQAADFKGGDSVQIRETAKKISLRGHTVGFTNNNKPDTTGFDIVHIFNCRHYPSFKEQVEVCKERGVPIVVSPIWVNIPKAFWGSRASLTALDSAVKSGEENHPLLQQLKDRRLVLEEGGELHHSTGQGSEKRFALPEIGEELRRCDALLPNSYLELQSTRDDLGWNGIEFGVAKYGVDTKVFMDSSPRLFTDATGIKPGFVLQAGRIEPAKNQAMLCWALKNENVRVVLIGSSSNWPSYAELCKEILGERLTIIDHLEPAMLASAYSAAAVHVLPSWCETCGLVSLEAAMNNTPVVGSIFGHEVEYLQQDALYVDPADPDSIRMAVMKSIEEGKFHQRVGDLKKRIMKDLNWETPADAALELYERVVNG